jgi:hypothetical protein
MVFKSVRDSLSALLLTWTFSMPSCYVTEIIPCISREASDWASSSRTSDCESLGFVGEADREHQEHQHRHVAAHERAAATHDQAAEAHRRAAEFFEEHGEPGKADRERDLADRQAQEAETERREAAAREDLPP